MIRSMTGFGRAQADDGKRSIQVEIKAVNHRYLDMNIRMPKSLMALEERIRKRVSQQLLRGKTDIFITYRSHDVEQTAVGYRKDLATSYVEVLRGLQEDFGLVDDVSVGLVARMPDVVYAEEREENVEEVWVLLEKALEEALTILQEMRTQEGASLRGDLLGKSREIQEKVHSIATKDKDVVPLYKARLMERLQTLLDNVPVDEQRIAMEIAIYTDKAGIDEEITRLRSHMRQFEAFLDQEEAVGRKLDFLAQEMNREANTMASKSVDITITNLVLEIKNDIEKIREQIQNIE